MLHDHLRPGLIDEISDDYAALTTPPEPVIAGYEVRVRGVVARVLDQEGEGHCVADLEEEAIRARQRHQKALRGAAKSIIGKCMPLPPAISPATSASGESVQQEEQRRADRKEKVDGIVERRKMERIKRGSMR